MHSRTPLKLAAALLLFATMMLTACSGGGGGGGGATATAVTLTGVTITPATASVAKGQNTFFTATANYSDGSNSEITSQATWSSTDETIAVVNSTTGVATGLVEGSTAISATFNGITSAEVPLTVTAAVVTDITISASSYTTPKGLPVTFTAMATYSDGTSGDISGSVTWSSSDETVATLNGSGIASTLAQGTSDISAAMESVTSNTVTLTVTPPELVSIALTPGNASVTEGLTTVFDAIGTYTDSTITDLTTKVTWQSNDNTIATISANGAVTGIAVGSTTLYATLDGITSPNANLTVTAAVITGISITPTSTSAPLGLPVTFTAMASYNNGTSGNVSGSVSWVSSDTNIATINGTGIASTLTEGFTTINAYGYGFYSNNANLTVTAPALASITITPAATTVLANSTKLFSASGLMSDGTPAPLNSLNWYSSDEAVATINSSGRATALAAGSTNITASSGAITSNTAVLAVTSAAPQGVFAISGNYKATLTWAPVSNAYSYNIYWGTGPGITTGSAKISNVTSGYVQYALSPNTTYYYRVSAVSILGEALSDEVFSYVYTNGALTETFTAAATMSTARYNHTATRLPDGKVLLAAGYNGTVILNTAERYDPATNTVSTAGSMAKARYDHTATLLRNGQVLVAAGYNGAPLDSAELYDPATNTFKAAGSLNTARYYHTATLLPNNQVLITGGQNGTGTPLSSAELYDPATNSFQAVGSLNAARYYHTATLLPNGKVLVAGGVSDNATYLDTAELFDPATNTFSTVSSTMSTKRYSHTATLLPNGKVLLPGGYSGSAFLKTAELFNPVTNTFTAAGSMVKARYGQTANLLSNGMVLIAGGFDNGAYLSSAELYDPATNTFALTASMNTARQEHTATVLSNGKVLVGGGTDGTTYLNTTELFQ